jgi:hypothetical protein
MNGITMIMAGGGAFNDNRASRLAKEANRVAGRCLIHDYKVLAQLYQCM